MQLELESRNVQCNNFYDIALDYILVDSFEVSLKKLNIFGYWEKIYMHMHPNKAAMGISGQILDISEQDLECPPSSVSAVMNNRWLSNGFKESALNTAIWGVLKVRIIHSSCFKRSNATIKLIGLSGEEEAPHLSRRLQGPIL